MSSPVIRSGRQQIAISHPDKALFARPTVTKLDLARYYERIADAMLPHVRGRPLALQVYPQGIAQRGFFMKSVPAHFPPWIKRTEVPKKGGTLTQILADDAATLIYLAGQDAVTPHIWLSRVSAPRAPDRLIIDLDPSPGIGFAAVRAAAREAGALLSAAGLVPHAMVTGSRGIHVVCPIRPVYSFKAVHGYARQLAEGMVRKDPKRLTLEWRRADRGPRIYLDVNRINYAQHAVAPYGIRALPRAPAAVPIYWDELSDRKLKPDGWTIRTAGERVASEGDAWKGIGRRARKLPA